MTDVNSINKSFLIVNSGERFEIFFNSSIFFAILNCIALLILLTISCLVTCLWFMMLLCCRDSSGIIEDIQNSIDEIKPEINEKHANKRPSDKMIDDNLYSQNN